MSFLVLEGIGKLFGPMAALEEIDLAVEAGSRAVIVGPSGSGKTTLLRIIAGFEAPQAGRVTLGGEAMADAARFVPAHRRGIGFVAQDGALFPHLSVADNIGFGLDRAAPGRAARIAGLMAKVDLAPRLLRRRPHELSGGQQQRVALARALAREPRLMLLDEPFSALDTGLRESTRQAVGEALRAAGITTILVTHDQAEALSFADQLAVLREGRLVQSGAPRELYLRPADRRTAAFLGDAIVLAADLGDGWAQCILGRVPAATGERRGAGEIMLRPEQLRLLTFAAGSPCRGVVKGLEFGGAVSTVQIEVAREILAVKTASADLPAVGGEVGIAVTGQAHVFAQTPAWRRIGEA